MNYSYRSFKSSTERNRLIIDHCRNKSVLHLGATDAPFTEIKYKNDLLLHTQIMKVAANVKGIDIDQPSIDFLSTKGINNIESFDMNQLGNLDFKPDVIVFGEIIEHLQNLQTALSNLKSIMGTETTLIISTPNLFYILNFLIVLMQNRECIHEDHKTGFTYGSLRQLLEANKLSIEAFHFVHLPRKHYYWYQQISQWICRLRPGVSETLLVIAKRST
mgnify:CR=1 FL=1